MRLILTHDVDMKTNNSILIIEDDLDVRTALVDVIGFYGVDIHEASNGKEALELLETIPQPRLIILDAMMPVMDGPEFFIEFRRKESNRKVPVVLFSAVAENISLEGLAGVLRKPADINDLLEYVHKYCEVSLA